MKTRSSILAALACSTVSTLALAEPASAEPTPPVHSPSRTPGEASSPPTARGTKHTHDGFYLSTRLSPSYLRLKVADSMVVSGVGANFGLALGGTVAENLIIYGEVFTNRVSNPDVEINGSSGEAENIVVNAGGVGPGLVYYFMPSNVFVGASVLISSSRLSDEDGNELADTSGGLGGAIRVGWEHWVADDWGLGVVAETSYGTMEDKVTEDDLSAMAFSLGLSASYQ